MKVDREKAVREFQKDDCFKIVPDPEGGSEVIVYLTEKGRDQMIGIFYSEKEKRELKRLFKQMDPCFLPSE